MAIYGKYLPTKIVTVEESIIEFENEANQYSKIFESINILNESSIILEFSFKDIIEKIKDFFNMIGRKIKEIWDKIFNRNKTIDEKVKEAEDKLEEKIKEEDTKDIEVEYPSEFPPGFINIINIGGISSILTLWQFEEEIDFIKEELEENKDKIQKEKIKLRLDEDRFEKRFSKKTEEKAELAEDYWYNKLRYPTSTEFGTKKGSITEAKQSIENMIQKLDTSIGAAESFIKDTNKKIEEITNKKLNKYTEISDSFSEEEKRIISKYFSMYANFDITTLKKLLNLFTNYLNYTTQLKFKLADGLIKIAKNNKTSEQKENK